MKLSSICLALISLFLIPSCTNAPKTLSEDGAWCWFSDPRAIYIHGESPGVLSGWVTADGSIEAALLDPKTEEILKQNLNPQLEIDDHDNPAFVETSNGYMSFYTKHSKKSLYYHHNSTDDSQLFDEAILFDPTSEEELEKFPLHHITYANPYMLKNENNRIYCFGRWTGYKPNVMWSDDMGLTFTSSKVLIAEEGFRSGNRPYVKYFSDGESKIHFLFTTGHPRNEPLNSVYYAYYEGGSFYKADGTLICKMDELPFRPKDATIVYKATEEKGRAWIYDIATDKNGDIGILYARYPSEQEHIYEYAIFENGVWTNNEICNSGKWFPQTEEGKTEREPHYSGGMTINPQNLSEIFVSKEVNGIFEIEQKTTSDKGASWKTSPITINSSYDNVRPFFPRNMQEGDEAVLLWMENEKYIHYTNYKTKIKYIIL